MENIAIVVAHLCKECEMRLWNLFPSETVDGRASQWSPWYNKAFGFVIRAETEKQARQIATDNSGGESHGGVYPWMDERYSICEELTQNGVSELVLRDYRSA